MTSELPLLVVVTGPPASGKSTTARELAAALGIALLSKDEVKERMYEVFGSGDEVEPLVERAALSVVLSVAATNLRARAGVLVESNFDARTQADDLRALAGDHDCRLVQVHLGAGPDEVAEAFAERAASGNRHPGHRDSPADKEEVRARAERGEWDPLDLPGELISLDGGDDVDPRALAGRIAGR